MITKVSHQIADHGPADLGLPLTVTRALHLPIPAPRKPEPAPRAPEVVATPVPELMGLRTAPVRTHRRKVPLNRLTAVRA
ncbi:hypothetical protein FB563_3107 [Streptomyces puniciscabiei]|uniref:Uncharacterized protein n=1 Tax=Streptomyces puniciscabiei TaxID=164348 RepID=A0A542UGA7_9ACTN|nr:hypothetical protein [Streptomyces puniciscabiei]TQK98093.1 hypothetical protein FB563_3107 [Streptomyces puniciscabiei]